MRHSYCFQILLNLVRQFSIRRKKVVGRLSGISEQTLHNLIRCMYFPQSTSTEHWLREAGAFFCSCLTNSVGFRRRPTEQIFNLVGKQSETTGQFALSKSKLKAQAEICANETCYGMRRKLKLSQIAFGLWIFYVMTDPRKKYAKQELPKLLNQWFDIIAADPIERPIYSPAGYKDVRIVD